MFATALVALLFALAPAQAQHRGGYGGGGPRGGAQAQRFSAPAQRFNTPMQRFNTPMQRNFAAPQQTYAVPQVRQYQSQRQRFVNQGSRSSSRGQWQGQTGRHLHLRGGGWFFVPFGSTMQYSYCDPDDPYADSSCMDDWYDD